MQSRKSFLGSFFSFAFQAIVLCSIAASAFAQQTSPSDAKPSVPPGLDPKTMLPLYETIQEDWSSLAIGASKLQPEEPLVALTEEKPTALERWSR